MKLKHRSVNGVGVVQSEYDYSEELSKPCNDNEHDIFWNGIQIRINITNGYIPNVINHFEEMGVEQSNKIFRMKKTKHIDWNDLVISERALSVKKHLKNIRS